MAAITTLLDLTWLTVFAICSVFFLVIEIRQPQRKRRASRALGVLLSLVVLFPCVSASDDLIGLALLSPRTDRQDETSILNASESREGLDFELGVRLLALDYFQVAPSNPAPTPFRFTAKVPVVSPAFAGYTPHSQASRPPPSVSFPR